MLLAVLREAEEELNLPRDHVEVLGALNAPEYSLGNRARVWAFVVSHCSVIAPVLTSDTPVHVVRF